MTRKRQIKDNSIKFNVIHQANYVKRDYEEHLDFEMLTPTRLCKPLLLTAHLFLPITAIAVYKGFYVLSCFCFPVYLTSLWHWHNPKTSSLARKADTITVLCAFCYGTYTTFLLQREITILWCSTAVFQLCVFSINYVLFLHQVEKPDTVVQMYIKEKLKHKDVGDHFDCYESFIDEHKHYFESSDSKMTVQNYINLHPTWPMTRERQNAYYRGVYIHMVCIHIIPCVLAIYCLIVGERQY